GEGYAHVARGVRARERDVGRTEGASLESDHDRVRSLRRIAERVAPVEGRGRRSLEGEFLVRHGDRGAGGPDVAGSERPVAVHVVERNPVTVDRRRLQAEAQ